MLLKPPTLWHFVTAAVAQQCSMAFTNMAVQERSSWDNCVVVFGNWDSVWGGLEQELLSFIVELL